MNANMQLVWIRFLLNLSRYIDSRVSASYEPAYAGNGRGNSSSRGNGRGNSRGNGQHKINGNGNGHSKISERHSERVAYWVKATARLLGVSEPDVRMMYWAAMFHDIGKIGVPMHVLSKAGPLNDSEWVMMKLHPIVGTNMVKSLNMISRIAPIIYSHQEKYDGTGYPEGLSGDNIPFGARILSVIDAYDAMTSNRVYRMARSHEEAALELIQMAGMHFDPQVVKVFLRVLENNGRH
ncbi:MAG: HD-GYP domain-containing protein [Anaerolineales bacterium]